MAKASFARASLSYGAVATGISDLELGEEYSEIDVTDTESTLNESEYLGGRRSRPISFTLFKDATVADLAMNASTAVSIVVTDASANTTTYSGNIILLTKRVTGNIDGAVVVAYTGRAVGAIAEAQA